MPFGLLSAGNPYGVLVIAGRLDTGCLKGAGARMAAAVLARPVSGRGVSPILAEPCMTMMAGR